jgi:hypothetical protein
MEDNMNDNIIMQEIEIGMKEICEEKNVRAQYVDYIGYTDVAFMKGDNAKMYQFNILDPNHPDYKSTVAWCNF